MAYRWLRDLDVAARKSGLRVVEIGDWKNHGRPSYTGNFDPKGIVAHHTGDRATGRRVAEGVLQDGRSGLPGPLCQLGLDKDGTVYVIAAGRANHAGTTRSVGFMRAGDGNAQAIGIEAFNSGSEGWSAKQIDAYYRLCAALCDHYGWSRNNVLGHGETSRTGKWDPGSGTAGRMLNMNTFRDNVKAVNLRDSEPRPKTKLSDWDPSDFGPGESGPQITMLDKRLLAHGFASAEANPTVWSTDLQSRVSAAQRAQGFSGTDADGLPGTTTLAWLTANPAYDLTPLDADWRVTMDGKWGLDGPHGERRYERGADYHLWTERTALIDGHRWYITATGTWYDENHLVPWVNDVEPPVDPPVDPPPVGDTYVVQDGDTLYGIGRKVGIDWTELAQINGLADATLIQPGQILKLKAAPIPPLDPPDEEEPPVEEPEPPVEQPEPAVTVRLRAGTGNANVYWRGNWDARVNNVANVFQRGACSVVHLCETSTAAAGAAFVREMGWGNAADQVDSHDNPRRTDSFDVHGGPHAGVRVGQFWDPSKRRVLKVHDFTTVAGTRNSGALMVLLQDIDTKILSVWVCGHLEFEPKGANEPASHWGNKRRYDQARDLFAAGESKAAEWRDEFGVDWIPVFVGGDMNGDLNDVNDGPGKAADDAGFVDSDKVAENRINGAKSTHARANFSNGGRIDRWFVPKKGVRVIEQETLDAYPHTDHNVVTILVEFNNERP